LTARFRRRLGRELRETTALKEVRAGLQAVEKRTAAEHDRLDRQLERAERQVKRVDKLTETLAAVQERLGPIEGIFRVREVDHERMSSQLAALEARVGRLEEHLADHALVSGSDAGLDAEGRATATSLLDEIRREHEQIRVRMQVITWYEERLRRVEASLVSLYDGDRRHPV
jgi:chromosome segregation ATPase